MNRTNNLTLRFFGITCLFGIAYAVNNTLTPWLKLVPGAHLMHAYPEMS